MGMFFGSGKRKGFSSFKVVDRSNKTRKSTVQLPSTLPLEKEQHRSVEDVEQGEEEEDPCVLCDGDPPDSDDDVVPTSSTSSYKMRKERLHKNWESLRSTLLKFSVEMEGFVPHQCNCGKTVESRCRDCSFTAYFCLDCCNHLHQTKHHFHHPEIIQCGREFSVSRFVACYASGTNLGIHHKSDGIYPGTCDGMPSFHF